MTKNEQLAWDCFQCYVSKNRARLEEIIATDFHFTSPLDNRIDRATYFERCWPNSEHQEGFDLVRIAESDDVVFVTYEGIGQGGSRFRNTEVLTVRDGQIHEVEVYFGWSVPHKAEPGSFVDEV